MYIHPVPVYEGEVFEIPLPSRAQDGSGSAVTWADGDFSFYKDGGTTATDVAAAVSQENSVESDSGKGWLVVNTAGDPDFTLGSRWMVWAEKTIDTIPVVECVGVFRMETAPEKASRLLRQYLYPTDSEISVTAGNTSSSINMTDVVDAQTTKLAGELFAHHRAADDSVVIVRCTAFTYPDATVETLDAQELPNDVVAGDHVWRIGQHTATTNNVTNIADQTTLEGLGDTVNTLAADVNEIVDGAGGLSAAAVDSILDEVVEGTTTVRQMLRGYAAALLGKASGLATTTATFRDIDDSKDRIVATVDANGNRTAVTLDLT